MNEEIRPDEAALMYILGAEDAQAGSKPSDDHPDYVMGYNEHRTEGQPVAQSR